MPVDTESNSSIVYSGTRAVRGGEMGQRRVDDGNERGTREPQPDVEAGDPIAPFDRPDRPLGAPEAFRCGLEKGGPVGRQMIVYLTFGHPDSSTS